MSVSVIDRLSTNFTDTSLPKLYRDTILNSGSRYLFDFLDSYSNPNADGALSAGAVFKNMVDGAPDGEFVGAAAIANLAGKAGLSMPGVGSGGSVTSYIDLGVGYDMAALDHDFLDIVWFKTPASGLVTGFPQILVLGAFGGESTLQLSLSGGTDGNTPRFSVANSAGVATTRSAAAGTGGGARAQMAVSRVGNTVTLYVNGAQISTTSAFTGTLYSAAGQSAKLGAGYKGTIYRVLKEDLTLSGAEAGRTPAAQALAQVAADFAANSARFS
jgi:hypothetical protein